MASERRSEGRQRILVGCDGSPGANDAIELARALAEPGAEVVLVGVDRYTTPDPATVPLVGYERRAVDDELSSETPAGFDAAEVKSHSYYGLSPARVLSALAEEEGFDLVVVGSPHRGPVGRALLGSVAQGLMHGVKVPTVVAPRGYAGGRHSAPKVIAVSYNGMPEAVVALRHAEALARGWGAQLRVLTVASLPLTPAGALGYVPPMPGTPDQVLAEGVAAVGAGVEVEGRTLKGRSVAAALAEDCGDVDLLVCGSRGYGPFSRVMIGSVSTALIHTAPCPVLVVPRPGAAGGEPGERDQVASGNAIAR